MSLLTERCLFSSPFFAEGASNVNMRRRRPDPRLAGRSRPTQPRPRRLTTARSPEGLALPAVTDRFGSVDEVQLAAEQRARVLIDRQLADAGWTVQHKKGLNLFAGQGVAVREVIMAAGHGRADYLLYVDQRAVGVIEAKPVGMPLSGVEWQSAMYADGLPPEVRLKALTHDGRLPFVFEASGSETHFTNGFDPSPRARRIFAFPRPETFARALRDGVADPAAPTWRAKVKQMPEIATEALRPAQIEAVIGIERSLAEERFTRSLVQMATGAGKTFTAVTEAYRLLKHGGFRRVLFLVDRNNLGDQTLREFQNYSTPDDGRRFTELYNVDKLTGAGMVGSSHVVISTIQRVYAALCGRQVADVDDPGIDGYTPDAPSTSCTTLRCRPKRSTWSSSTRLIGRSTACGAECSSTSTPTSSG